MTLAGLEKAYTYQTIGEIAKLWNEFGPKYFNRIPNQVGKEAYGVSHGMTESGFLYMAGAQVSSTEGLPAELKTLDLPAATYAVFPHAEHVSKICDTIDAIYNGWLKESGTALADFGVIMEVYLPEFDPETCVGNIEIWMAVKR